MTDHRRARRGAATRIGLLASAIVLLAGAPARAATFTVNTTDDTTVAGGCTTAPACSLRDAVGAANAASGPDVVSIPAGTYALATNELLSSDEITLAGAGARSTVIKAPPNGRVFHGDNLGAVVAGPAASLSDLTITGGSGVTDGGGIFAEGPLNLLRVIVTGNSSTLRGAGVDTPNTVDITSSTVPGDVPVTVTDSLIAGNTVAGTSEAIGGAIATSGDLTVTNSTITGNVTRSAGMNQAGGIQSSNGVTTLVNSTIAGNTAEAGTMAFGAGITDTPPATHLIARNTIIAGNKAGDTVQNCALSDLTPESTTNITDDTSCRLAGGGTQENVDPRLKDLAPNGGPTDTRSFAIGAPPQDAGTNAACPAADQRGVKRPAGAACDIGAVELAPPAVSAGFATGFVTTGTASSAFRASPVSAATLGATFANPFIQAATSQFELGTTTAYGRLVDSSAIGPGASPAVQTVRAGGLQPNTVYHTRARAQNSDGAVVGPDVTFTTPRAATARQRRLARPSVGLTGVLGTRACTRQSFSVRIRVRLASGLKLRFVRVRIDKRLLKRTTRSSFVVRIPAATVGRGRHRVSVRATDSRGRTRLVARAFHRCGPVVRALPRFTG